jgi:hypothetical protein
VNDALKKPDPKLERLNRLGVRNPHPERVRAPWFRSGDFFDANDLILGWPIERVHVIDCDLGLSGASAQQRGGFQKLVSEVAIGHAGIVLGLEVSRLARNNADWHRLIELAALTRTLILDKDGVYEHASWYPCSTAN